MTNQAPEPVTGGLVGKLAGKAKEKAGDAFGDDKLAAEGRLQQAQVETDAEARREAFEACQKEG